MRCRAGCGLSLALSLAAAAPAVAQTDVPAAVSPVADPTPIASYGGHLVFSRANGAGGFELVQRVGDGPVAAVGVPPRSVPFDVDVGPTTGGHLLAVYTRCTTEPQANRGFPSITEYETGRGCDVYKADLTSGGAEQRYTKVNASDGTEFWPTYWKGRVGFARVYDHERDHPYLYVKTIESGDPSERMPGGDQNRSVPQALELYGTRLAFAWRFQGNSAGLAYDLRLDTVDGGHRLMDHVDNGQLTSVPIGWPSFEDGRLFWTRACFGDTSGCKGRERLVKSTYSGDIVELEATAPRPLLSHERDRLMTVVLTDQSNVADCKGDPPRPAGTCSVEYSRPDFSPRG